MNLEDLKKQLTHTEAELKNTYEIYLRIEGAVMMLRQMIASMEKSEDAKPESTDPVV